jgi:hypothetical protein
MFFRDKDKPMVAKGLVGSSVLAAGLAGVGALGYDLLLASTQWLLIGILLAAWGIFLLLEAEFRL